MLTIRTCKAFNKALGEYLRQADYYSQGMKVEGYAQGRLCTQVGLAEGHAITDEAFARIAGNHHAETGQKLTERMAAGRRAGYDAVFNAPKSVSIQAFLGGDERLIAAHEAAVQEALRELERYACHQGGRGINKRYQTSGAIAAAVFRHGESRALDPHLHSHAFIFNVTRDHTDPSRMLALESSPIFERTKYLTEVYRNALAREVQALGYAVERRPDGFELAGISSELLERFSKRAAERDRAIAAREAELGRELSRDEIAFLVRENRAEKQYELMPEEVRRRQREQLSDGELMLLQALKSVSPPAPALEVVALKEVIARAAEHVFERKTVVPEHEFMAEVIRQSYGTHRLDDIKTVIARETAGLLVSEGQVSTQASLDLERALVQQINAGVGAYDSELGFVSQDRLSGLQRDQQAAVRTVLGSFDRITVLRGRAGTGKTTVLATAIEGITPFGREVACFAPSTQAVDILKQDGAAQSADGRISAGQVLAQADTVQRLLVDQAVQQSIRQKVVIVDEYGLLSTRQLKELVDVVEKQSARLVLVGDSGQHKSVEAGDAARIVEKETRVRVVELKEVRRQAANPAYKAAAEDLAAERVAAGLRKLDHMGAVVEVANPTDRRCRMVDEWFRAMQETRQVRTGVGVQEQAKTALMVAPTWVEIDALNIHARHKLRAAGRISGSDQTFVSLRAKDWTKAQQKDIRNYQPGDIVVAHKATKQFGKGEELRVVRKEKGRLILTSPRGEISVSPRQSGLAWTVSEERAIPVAAGDRLRLRAVAHAQASDGGMQRLANGATFTVRSVDAAGRLVLADGSLLQSRQVVYGYAMTSHAAQGITVDKVFVAGAASREGLYVSATRGRESIRLFVPDREAFLEATRLRSEARMSALEFLRHRSIQPALRPHLLRAWHYLQQVRNRITVYLAEHPGARLIEPLAVNILPVRKAADSPRQDYEESITPRHSHAETMHQGVRTRL
ncbi:MAG: MobF family relaxase [Verrucomicrobiota bacterium]